MDDVVILFVIVEYDLDDDVNLLLGRECMEEAVILRVCVGCIDDDDVVSFAGERCTNDDDGSTRFVAEE